MNGCCFNPVIAQIIGVIESEPPAPLALFMQFDDILNAPVADPANVADWNTFYGATFTSVVVTGNDVELFGGVDVVIGGGLFQNNNSILQIIDYADCVIEVGASAFEDAGMLNTAIFNSVITVGDSAFLNGVSLVTAQFEAATTVGDASFISTILSTDCSFQSLITIGDDAFAGTAISDAAINTSAVTTIGATAFASTTAFLNPSFPVCTLVGESAFTGAASETIEFEILESIPNGFAASATNLQSASFPAATTAGEQSFISTGFPTIEPEFFPLLEETEYRAFYGLPNTTTIEFSSLTDIGLENFSNLASCTIITLPILAIADQDCLAANPALEEVYLPNLLLWGGSMLEGCPSLTTVDVESCTTIEAALTGSDGANMVFANMPSITDIASGALFATTTGNTVTVNVNAVLETIDAGNPAPWIVTLLADNPGSTVNYI